MVVCCACVVIKLHACIQQLVLITGDVYSGVTRLAEGMWLCQNYSCSLHAWVIGDSYYPALRMCSEGSSDCSWTSIIIIYIIAFFFIFFKYSHSEVHSVNTGRLLFEFNGLQYRFAAGVVSVAFAVCRLGKGSTSAPETQTLPAPNHTPYGSRYTVEHAYSTTALYCTDCTAA